MKLKVLSIAVSVVVLGLIGVAPQPAQAAIATCPGDYYNFIFTARSESTRKQSLGDFFKLGSCQLNDILTLEDELDQVKESFRSTAETCGDTSTYKVQYAEILMEEYFVRNIQKSSSDVINEVDEEKLKALKQAKLDALQIEMEALFVTKEHRTDETTFEGYFADWSSKYDDRIANYAHCEEGSWAELTTIWQKFAEDIKNLSIDVKTSKSSFSSTATGADEAKKDMSAMGQSIKNAWSFVKAQEEILKAEIPAATTPEDLSNSDTPISFKDAFQVLSDSNQEVSFQSNSADRMANYAMLYGSGSGVAATNMQSIVVYMNQIIDETNIKDFPKITAGAAKVYEKQCN